MIVKNFRCLFICLFFLIPFTLFAQENIVINFPEPPKNLKAFPPKNDSGRHINLSWELSEDDGKGKNNVSGYEIYRAKSEPTSFEAIKTLPNGVNEYIDKVEDTKASYYYYVISVTKEYEILKSVIRGLEIELSELENQIDKTNLSEKIEKLKKEKEAKEGILKSYTFPRSNIAGAVEPKVAFFNTDRLNLFIFFIIFFFLIGYFLTEARYRAKDIFIRRIPGVDAIEEAIGRATEMGKPVLYVPGIEDIKDIQTISSMMILGYVAEVVAQYNSEIIVPNRDPLVMTVSEEVVKQGFYKAGRPESHKPTNIRYISSEQFAFVAGTNGIIFREKPAANIFLGRFFAESLILAETGYTNRAIQVSGTAEVTQLPFFIAACDYTIIGEELYAVSAYLSRDAQQLSTLKSADWIKIIIIILILIGIGGKTAYNYIPEKYRSYVTTYINWFESR